VIQKTPESWEQVIQNRQTFLTGAQRSLGINPPRALNDDGALDNLKADLESRRGQYNGASRMLCQQSITIIGHLKDSLAKKNEQQSLEQARTELPGQIKAGINEVIQIIDAMDKDRMIHNQRIEDIKTYRENLKIAQLWDQESKVNELSKEMQGMLEYSMDSIRKILGNRLE